MHACIIYASMAIIIIVECMVSSPNGVFKSCVICARINIVSSTYNDNTDMNNPIYIHCATLKNWEWPRDEASGVIPPHTLQQLQASGFIIIILVVSATGLLGIIYKIITHYPENRALD